MRAIKACRAEQMMLGDAPIIPVWFQVSKVLVSPKVTGWVDNVVRVNRSRYLCFDEDGEGADAAAH